MLENAGNSDNGYHMKKPQIALVILTTILALGGTGITPRTAGAADKTVQWKPVDQAFLRIDEKAVKDWGAYQDGKKTNPLLVQIGLRYLLVDSSKHEIFEIDPGKIGHNGADLTWKMSDRPAKPLDTSDWTVRDVGLAYKVNARLVAEGRVLDLQLPHPLDIRFVH